jgi:hypothetical protein
MLAEVCLRTGAAVVCAAVVSIALPCAAAAQGTPATFKVAFYNIQSGKGEPALAGHPATFPDTVNCTDNTQPLNAWGLGMIQQHLVNAVGNDPRVVALGLAEAWLCGSPENVRRALGWKSRTSVRNGVGMVARFGFGGPEEWAQLDTSLNANPADTMWALRVPVCLDAACSRSMNVFVAHWYGTGETGRTSYDRQAQGTVAFMARTAGTAPHMLIGDLNAWEGTDRVCRQNPTNAGIPRLRDAGYVDAWPLLHGSAEGYTGMTNRAGCGSPEGYAWKRPDYTWALPNFLPVSIERFGIVPAGDAAPSDHYGIISEFPLPGAVAPVDDVRPVVSLLTPIEGLNVTGGPVSIAVAATDDLGVARVEIVEDGIVAHTLAPGQTDVSCATLAQVDGTHTVMARAFDAAGNMGVSEVRHIVVDTLVSGSLGASATGEIVLYAKNAAVVAGNWRIVADPQAAGGARVWNPDASAPKRAAAQAAPADYFELPFTAEAGRAYRLWVRGRADRDYWGNDSVYIQFSGSVDAAGVPVTRIGTTGSTWVSIEDCSGCGLLGWGWQDNAYGTGALGPLVYFAASGPQTIRVQQREDGISIDQIVLSPALYLTNAPGASKLDAVVLPMTTAPPPLVSRTEIHMTANSVTTVAGTWRLISDPGAAGGMSVGTVDAGAAKAPAAVAAPLDYVELSFDAEAGRAYRLWVRGRAERNSWANDSMFVQFSGALDAAERPVASIGSTVAYVVNLEDAANAGLSGWGWQDNGYGTGVFGPLLRFAASGPQTIRIQTREDGFRFDQIVLSSEQFLATAPGPLKNDTTILP